MKSLFHICWLFLLIFKTSVAIRLQMHPDLADTDLEIDLPSTFKTREEETLTISEKPIGRGAFAYVFTMPDEPNAVLKVSVYPTYLENKIRKQQNWNIPSREIECLKRTGNWLGSYTYRGRSIIKMRRHDGHPLSYWMRTGVIQNSTELMYFAEALLLKLDELRAKGIVHNDIHQDNILFQVHFQENDPLYSIQGITVHVLDYGLAQTEDDITENALKTRQSLDEMFVMEMFDMVAKVVFANQKGSKHRKRVLPKVFQQMNSTAF